MSVGNTNTFLKESPPIYHAKVYILVFAPNVREALKKKEPINKCKGYVERCLCEQLPLFTGGLSYHS